MMQLLHAAQHPIYSDQRREQDQHNPNGYFECEAVKGIVKNNQFLHEADAHAIKIVAPLVQYLDLSLNYRVIFMERSIDEVLQSQAVMIGKNPGLSQAQLAPIFSQHVEKSKQFLSAHAIPTLVVAHQHLLNNAPETLQQLIDFCELSCTVETLLPIIDPSLYRNRIQS
ncbi:MAG: hypothetical protein RLZZ301_263 [Bacteroidota bacterium]|jgi:hypothetical protein